MDLVTRLLLNSSQFDSNITNSAKQLKAFQDVGKAASNSVMKFAAGLGAVGSAAEIFNKFISAGQGSSDALSFALGTAKDSVDMFFTSLNTGDFTAFNKGINGTIKNLMELQRLRDDLADTKNSTSVFRSQYNYQAQALKAIINDPDSSKAQVAAAKAQLLKITKDFTKQLEGQNSINVAELRQNASAKTGRYYSANDIKNFATVYNNPASTDPRKQAFDLYNAQMKKLESRLWVHGTNAGNDYKDSKVEAQILKLRKSNNELDRMSILSKQGDKQWEEYYNSLKEFYDTKAEAEQNLNFAIKQEKKANKVLGIGEKKDKDKPTGSIAELDKELSDWNKKLSEATTKALRRSAQKMIDELEAKKIRLTFDAKYGDMKQVTQSQAGVLGDRTKGFTIPDRIEQLPTLISKENKKDINTYIDGLYNIANAIGTITGMTGKGASAWLNWGTSVLSSISAIIPIMSSLTTATEVQTAANTQQAGAEVTALATTTTAELAASALKTTAATAEMAAKSTAAYAAIPFVGMGLAASQIATMEAMIAAASIPKFANGGVVGGNSFYGDKILARLNSGEVVLNKNQQGILYNAMNEGPGDAKTTVKIKGSDLYLCLNNYKKQSGK